MSAEKTPFSGKTRTSSLREYEGDPFSEKPASFRRVIESSSCPPELFLPRQRIETSVIRYGTPRRLHCRLRSSSSDLPGSQPARAPNASPEADPPGWTSP